jgi:hypothetical protein
VLERGVLLPELMGGCSLDELDQSVYPKLGITANQQMHVIGHDLDLYKLLSPFLHIFLNEFLQPCINATHEHFAPVLGTPHHMIVAIIDTISVAPSECIHTENIAQNARYVNG